MKKPEEKRECVEKGVGHLTITINLYGCPFKSEPSRTRSKI
jgi:hypothetical protein